MVISTAEELIERMGDVARAGSGIGDEETRTRKSPEERETECHYCGAKIMRRQIRKRPICDDCKGSVDRRAVALAERMAVPPVPDEDAVQAGLRVSLAALEKELEAVQANIAEHKAIGMTLRNEEHELQTRRNAIRAALPVERIAKAPQATRVNDGYGVWGREEHEDDAVPF